MVPPPESAQPAEAADPAAATPSEPSTSPAVAVNLILDPEPEIARLNRNLNELLQELRISEVGVQILFAFLIALPFTSRFGEASSLDKHFYYATLMLAVLASALMISPAAYHRIVFRHHSREALIRYASRTLIAGLSMLMLAMAGAILVVTNFLFGSLTGSISAGCVALWTAFFWYVLPIRTRLRCEREAERAAEIAAGSTSSQLA